MNIKLKRGIPVNLYLVHPSIVVGSAISVQNMSGDPVYLSSSEEGLSLSEEGDCRQCAPGRTVMNENTDTGAFAVCYTRDVYINVEGE